MSDRPAAEPLPVAGVDRERFVCLLDELADPGAREFTLGSGDWPLRGFVIRSGETLRAYVNHCPHAGFPLNWRPDRFLSPDSSRILCATHGALFDIQTGECVAGPCPGQRLRSLAIRIEKGCVMLDAAVPLEEPPDLGV